MYLDRTILDNLEELPTLPTIYTALMDVMSNPKSTVVDVANVITQDQSATAKILKTVNSSVYGLEKKVETISDAVFYIGFNEIRNLVLALSIISLFTNIKSNGTLSCIDLWKHSIGVGVVTRAIGKAAGINNLENYFLAGILHDIGKLVFLKYYSKEYTKVLDYAAEKDTNISEAEFNTLGITHTVLGDMIAEKWGLPASIRLSIKHHRTGLVDSTPDIEVACVHLANITARMLEFGYSGDRFVPKPNNEIWRILKLPENFFSKNTNNLISDYEQSISIFQLGEYIE